MLPDPSDAATFVRSKVDWTPTPRAARAYALTRDLLRLRREDPVLARQDRSQMHGAVLGRDVLALRFDDAEHGDRLILTNFGADRALDSVPEPLLAPPLRGLWELVFSSEHVTYGGEGTPDIDSDGSFLLAAHSTVYLQERRSTPSAGS
jgi:maltooligosyltrehalose trehalohydrolase